jgi:hypothetical protein
LTKTQSIDIVAVGSIDRGGDDFPAKGKNFLQFKSLGSDLTETAKIVNQPDCLPRRVREGFFIPV